MMVRFLLPPQIEFNLLVLRVFDASDDRWFYACGFELRGRCLENLTG
jgi:hypothetical protein